MFITYISRWLYQVMQLPVPIVLSPQHIYSISIWSLFTGVLLLGIFMLLIERAFGDIRLSDFRIKERAPETTDNIEKSHASTDLNGYDSIGRRRFPGLSSRTKYSMGQKIIRRRNKERAKENMGVRLVQQSSKNTVVYESLEDYKMKKANERNDE